MQKQTLGEIGTLTIIWWPVLSGILYLKLLKSGSSFFKLQSITLGCFLTFFALVNAYFVYSVFP